MNEAKDPFKKIPFTSSLAFRFSLFFLTGILVIFSVAFYWAYDYAYNILLKDAENDARNITLLTITRIENVLQPIQQIPITLSQALDVVNPNYGDVINITRDVVIENPVIYGSCLAFEPFRYDPEHYWYGAYQYETRYGIRNKILGSPSYNYFEYDWYRLPRVLNKPVWTEPYFDEGGGDTLMCTYSVPFYTYDKKGNKVFSGVLTLDISLNSLAELANDVRLFKSGFGFLISAKGKVMTYQNDSLVNRNIIEIAREQGHPENIQVVEKMLKGDSGFVRVHAFDRGGDGSMLYYAPVSSTGWSFALVFPIRELFSDLIDFIWQLVIIFMISVTAIMVMTILMIRKFTMPISRLVGETQRIGHGDFNHKIPVIRQGGEISQLSSAFSTMQEELVSYINNLRATTIAKEKMESELQIAHHIQMGMLPDEVPDLPDWDLHGLLVSARAVGGDFYDFFFPDNNHLCFAIGDVSGKGVPAALFMMMTRTLLRSRMRLEIPINQVMSEMNRDLCQENGSQMFVTFFICLLDLKSGSLVCCNAGHNLPFILKANGMVDKTGFPPGIPLGIMEDFSYTSVSFTLNRGDYFIMYTDGVTDAENPSGNMLDSHGLTDLVAGQNSLTSQQLCEKILGGLRLFAAGAEQSDDITLLILRHMENDHPETDRPPHQTLLLWNQLSELERINSMLEELAAAWNLTPKLVMELNLVLEELFTNIVFYAYGDGLEHQISLSVEMTGDKLLRLTLTDDGKPFNLLEQDAESEVHKDLADRRIGGLGIHFVKELMTSVAYERREGKNIVILTRSY